MIGEELEGVRSIVEKLEGTRVIGVKLEGVTMMVETSFWWP